MSQHKRLTVVSGVGHSRESHGSLWSWDIRVITIHHHRCRHSIPQAPVRNTTQVAVHHIKTSQSPSRRWIPRVPTGDAHQWQHTTSKPVPVWDARFHKCPLRRTSVAAHNIKASHSPSNRSIPQMLTGDSHQWQHAASKPAIAHLDARFHKHPTRD